MKREEAKQILQMYKDEIGQRIDTADAPDVKDVYRWQMDGFNMAIEALQRSAWIPVGDEPPKQKKTYWVCTDGGYQCECRWTNINPVFTNLTTDWHWCIFDVTQHSKVVAWKPLPEPYKGGDNE